ncbi:hypothetical protein DFJ74DRAFT_686308 [Hyaloraphidium curvatum]|nr:hypothetical protein DFJ74DRAFT_686308 [Hyaloraphidium curvatum]
MDVAPGIHCVVSEFTLTMNDGAGGRASYGTHSINFVNDALESVRSIGVNDPTDASAVKTIQDVMTRIIGGPIPGEAEAQAALHKVFDLINAHDAAGLSEMFADDAVWIAPWFKVCKGKEGDALVKASFDGGMKSVKMLEKPYTLEPFTAVVRAEVVNEGLFPVKVTQTMYRIMLDPATGKITRLAQYVDDLKGVETMRRLYNKEFAGPAESA